MTKKKQYRVVDRGPGLGIEWTAPDGSNRRAEAGDIVDDLPVKSIGWLLADGLVEEIEAGGAAKDEEG